MKEFVNKLLGRCLLYTGMYVTMSLQHTGETGVGKSTLIDSLFKTSFDGESSTHTHLFLGHHCSAFVAGYVCSGGARRRGYEYMTTCCGGNNAFYKSSQNVCVFDGVMDSSGGM